MGEPRLEDMSDYDTLQGKKKKVVLTVIFVGVLMGVVYVGVNYFFGNVKDNLNVSDSVKTVPYK